MKLNIIDILKFDGAKLPFEGELTVEDQEFIGNVFSFPAPVTIRGEVTNQSGRFFMEASVSAKVASTCARCGVDVTEDILFQFTEVFTNVETEDDEMIPFTGTELFIVDVVINNLLENLPEKFLCKPDCKGLCPVCGVNRNDEVCACEEDEGDPRLEIFRKLAKKEEV